MQTEDVQSYADEQGLLFNEISAKQVRFCAALSVAHLTDFSVKWDDILQDIGVAEVFLGVAKALPKAAPTPNSDKLIIGGKLENEAEPAGCC